MINADVNTKNWLTKVCDKGFTWNARSCECECDKLCDVGEYLDYANCKCRKRQIDKLVEEYSEDINENELHSNELISVALNDYKNVCGSCTIYVVLLVIFFRISISISNAFIYFHWYL